MEMVAAYCTKCHTIKPASVEKEIVSVEWWCSIPALLCYLAFVPLLLPVMILYRVLRKKQKLTIYRCFACNRLFFTSDGLSNKLQAKVQSLLDSGNEDLEWAEENKIALSGLAKRLNRPQYEHIVQALNRGDYLAAKRSYRELWWLPKKDKPLLITAFGCKVHGRRNCKSFLCKDDMQLVTPDLLPTLH